MINGLSVHTSKAGGAVDYLLDAMYFDKEQKVWLERDPPAELLEGDPAQLVALCDSLSFKNTYTNGCLSFTHEETAKIFATPGMREKLIEDLREFAYAGVKNDDCKQMLIVQHTHTGRLELNYVIPRVNLESGKYFNPFPPNYNGKRGKGNNQAFIEQNDAFVDYMCSKYVLQNPRDPSVSREVKINKFDPELVTKKMINDKVGELVAGGYIGSRKDVVNFLEKAGGKITRLGQDYLSVKFDDKSRAIRLRGAYYSDQSFSEVRAELAAAKARFSDPDAPAEFESKYREIQEFRAGEVSKRHELKGYAAERASEFDRKSAAELRDYGDELKAVKDSLPDAGDFSRRVSEHIASDSALVSAGTAEGIETGVASSTSDADPILTGNPGADALIKAFHSMQKKLAAEELQRSKAKWQIDPNHEKMVREISDTMAKLFGGLAMGKNFVAGRPGAMSPSDIAQVQQMLTEQRRELDRELRAVAQVVKQKERTEPLRELVEPKTVEAKQRPSPAPLPAQVAKLVDKHAVITPARDIYRIGGIKTLRSGWLSDKSHDIHDEALLWGKKHDPAQVERGVIASMAQHKVPVHQAYQAVLEESAVVRGDAHYAADLVAQEYTRSALQAEGKPEVADLRAEAQKRYAELYKRAESGRDAELEAIHGKADQEAQVEQQLLDAEAKEKADQKRMLGIGPDGKKLKPKPAGDGTSGTTLG